MSDPTVLETPVSSSPPRMPENCKPFGSPPKKQRTEKHTTEAKFSIKHKSTLTEIAKKFTPAQPGPEAPTPKLKSIYFEKLDVAVRMELDHGTSHTIDVQPDLRFPLLYFMYTTAESYPDLTVKCHPFTSTFTLIAYQQIMLNAYLLICDLYCREPISIYAARFKNDSSKMDFLNRLMDCYIPDSLSTLLTQLAPT